MSALERVRAAYGQLALVDRPEVWISLVAQPELEAAAIEVDARVSAGDPLPLAGLIVAVKDNIDVAGLPTTAACPGFSFQPERSAPVVARLIAAGALVMGKTNLDQFATGLVGTRSPYGAVRDALRPDRISGGSSSGSAVAVALGIVDAALGTDTAGSGRIPAAFGGIVGLKPTRGLIPTVGVVPAVRDLDCVSILAPTVATALAVLGVAVGVDATDPTSRAWPPDAPVGAPPRPVVGIPGSADLVGLSPAWRMAFVSAVAALAATGVDIVEVDLSPYLEAGRLLYEGAFVASRYAEFGNVLASVDQVDPTVQAIVSVGADIAAHRFVADSNKIAQLRVRLAAVMSGVDAIVVPTAPEHPSLAEVAAEPMAVNTRLGRFTNGCNLLDLCAVAVPAGQVEGGWFGISVLAPAFADLVAVDIAARLLDEGPRPLAGSATTTNALPIGVPLLVIGAHMSGLPFNAMLTEGGGRLIGSVTTAPEYRLYDLGGTPARPGMVRTPGAGVAVTGELWELPPAGLASVLLRTAQPLGLGRVDLADGSTPIGFVCEAAAAESCVDISDFGGWRSYRAAVDGPAGPSTAIASATAPAGGVA